MRPQADRQADIMHSSHRYSGTQTEKLDTDSQTSSQTVQFRQPLARVVS